MSIEKQKLYKEIDTLPEELINVEIKSKSDLKEKIQKGLDDIKQNRTYSLDEVFQKLDNL